MSKHPWDDGASTTSTTKHPWDDDGDDDDFLADDDPMSDSEAELPPTDPSSELIDFCKQLFYRRNLTAKQFCTIMHWCGKAGLKRCEKLGHNPEAPSDHFTRHLNSVMPNLRNRERL